MSSALNKRFHVGYGETSRIVIDVPVEEYNRLGKMHGPNAQRSHVLVEIKTGGIASKILANTWAEQICDQLNGFDIANAAVAKLKPSV